jgi:predicted DNA-binding protein (UPF0278 family)
MMVEESKLMEFSEALHSMLHKGVRVARACWREGKYISYGLPDDDITTEDYIKVTYEKGSHYRECTFIRTFWLPSCEDLFAEDWYEVA